MSQTLDQKRANHAYQAVEQAIAGQGHHRGQDKNKFGRHAKKLPIRILTAGLGPALAFIRAKRDEAPGLLAVLDDWMAQRIAVSQGQPVELLQRVVSGNADFLRRATDETIAYLQWLNRFAEARGITDDEQN